MRQLVHLLSDEKSLVPFHLQLFGNLWGNSYIDTAQKMFSNRDFFSKCDQIPCFLQIGSHYWRNSKWKTSFFVQCEVLVGGKSLVPFHLQQESVTRIGIAYEKFPYKSLLNSVCFWSTPWHTIKKTNVCCYNTSNLLKI